MKKDYRTNSNGIIPEYSPGERVYHSQARKYATIVEQILDKDNSWGNAILTYDNDTVETVVPAWQLSRVIL